LHHASDAGRHATPSVLPPGIYDVCCGHCCLVLSGCESHIVVLLLLCWRACGTAVGVAAAGVGVEGGT
jgi:hypothetical protein